MDLNIIIGIIFVNICMNFIIINYLTCTPAILQISHTKNHKPNGSIIAFLNLRRDSYSNLSMHSGKNLSIRFKQASYWQL
jgi:hypothetical protein